LSVSLFYPSARIGNATILLEIVVAEQALVMRLTAEGRDTEKCPVGRRGF